MQLTLGELQHAIGGELRRASDCEPEDSLPVGHVVVDSRHVAAGDVFWGLKGSRQDGASFAEDAFMRGAAGCVLSGRSVEPPSGGWTLEVSDALEALWRLARWKRAAFTGTTIGITGSVGKTTTREMIHAVLGQSFRGSASPANYNNHIGLPLSLLDVCPADHYAAIELGASAPGEIRKLAALAKPWIGVITQVGEAHLAGFGSTKAIAEGKAELLESLPVDGHAILNGDDAQLRRMADRCRSEVTWVGRGRDCDLVATDIRSAEGMLSFKALNKNFDVPVWGRHHLTSALAAIAVGRLMGVPLAAIAQGLRDFEPVSMRCEVMQRAGATIINDCYNSSPTAMRAALELLGELPAAGRRIVVCGDMRGLGPQAEQLHRQLGQELVAVCGTDLVVACGDHAAAVIDEAITAGMSPEQTFVCRDVTAAAATLREIIAPGDAVLIKGSRGLGMEQVVNSLTRQPLAMAA